MCLLKKRITVGYTVIYNGGNKHNIYIYLSIFRFYYLVGFSVFTYVYWLTYSASRVLINNLRDIKRV